MNTGNAAACWSTRPQLPLDTPRAMQTTNRGTEEGTALPTNTTRIGIDTEGRRHTYARSERTVYVSNGETFMLEDTPCTGVEDWIRHVDDVCGWRELYTRGDDPAETLARRLAQVMAR